MLMLILFGSYALGLWFGGHLILQDLIHQCTSKCHTGGNVLTVFWGVLFGAMSLLRKFCT